MDVKQIKSMGRKLRRFLAEFEDCFYRSEQRGHLYTYMTGQISQLPRKSIEPIALRAGIPPRTLQYFMATAPWDGPRLRDRIQWIVARDHGHPRAIGIIDETGNPKKGRHTCGVQRQWCGNSGKIDNCVVGVHLGYVVDDFQCLLDSDLYLPKEWADDPERRQAAGVPDDVEYRKKTDMALAQVSRALSNGIRCSAWTFDEWYGRDGAFLDGLDSLGQNYVGEIPANFTGWSYPPEILQKPTPAQRRKRGRKRHFPRLSQKASPVSEVRNLATYSRLFQKQKWKRFRIKDGEKGPIVWEVKQARFYRQQGPDGLPGAVHTLLVARNLRQPKEIKYFLSNMAVAGAITLEWLLWVAFSRWPIERCFELGKRDLGFDHFEVRSWPAIHRHFYISQLSQLFCSRVHQQLREKKDKRFVFDGGTGLPGRLGLDYRSMVPSLESFGLLSKSGRDYNVPSISQPASSKISPKKGAGPIAKIGCQNSLFEFV